MNTFHPQIIALAGNPNSGKTTLFNALTGMRQKVGNYPGVTVEKKEGKFFLENNEITLLDLPGTYSLTPRSPDEKITADILLGKSEFVDTPQAIVCVVDANNLERNLFLASQIIDLQIPVVVALTMLDNAENSGVEIDAHRLSALLGVPVVEVNALQKFGLEKLKKALLHLHQQKNILRLWKMPEPVEKSCEEIQKVLEQEYRYSSPVAFFESLRLLSSDTFQSNGNETSNGTVKKIVESNYQKLELFEIDRHAVAIESRYAWIQSLCIHVLKVQKTAETISDKLDRIFTHKIFGFVVFFLLMGIMFQSIFAWSNYPMELIDNGVQFLASNIRQSVPSGDFQDLLVNGVLSGVGAVIMFLPQILFLFFFLGILEDSGYMSRAAFIMDKLMSRFGLHGKSFIPLLSSFACAIPGIMSTRTIENTQDRLATILVAPLMSCSARLPVYTLMVAAFVPSVMLFGIISLPAIVIISLYLVGVFFALTLAAVFKKTILKSAASFFIMELPPYRIPSWKTVGMYMWERAMHFLQRAGTIILGVSIILWFLATYPKLEHATPSERLEHSFVGKAGHLIEPIIQPLGFDWKIGIGMMGSLLQREVFVSTMGTIYNIQTSDNNSSLLQKMQNDIDTRTGEKIFTPLVAICLMVYYVLAMQCMSTIAVTRRETNGWKWPLVQFGYMTVLAYSVTFAVHFVGTFFDF
jgi:ferrous iron transport protein B